MKSKATIMFTEPSRELLPEEKQLLKELPRPRTRGDCIEMDRPCPWVGCRYHLFLEVTRKGTIQTPVDPEDEEAIAAYLHEMTYTCALDAAEEKDFTLEEIGEVLGVTHEGIRQVEAKALKKLEYWRKWLGGDND